MCRKHQNHKNKDSLMTRLLGFFMNNYMDTDRYLTPYITLKYEKRMAFAPNVSCKNRLRNLLVLFHVRKVSYCARRKILQGDDCIFMLNYIQIVAYLTRTFL